MHNSEKDVRKAQKWLRIQGSSIKETGKWSIGMTSAVIRFQKKAKLTPTGELDAVTWKALKKSVPWWKRF